MLSAFCCQQPISTTIACAVCLIFAFSIPMAKLKEKYRFFALLGALGLLPGFVLAGIIGPMVGEVSYDIQWGILIPPLDDAWAKVSPFAIGWPSMEMFIQGMPLALITYVILLAIWLPVTRLSAKDWRLARTNTSTSTRPAHTSRWPSVMR
ncbi:hypothetical protein ULF88_21645 [Halopseudomonas pachastrellae]|nr:hypothetical protein [Halopseudomonas pachastrellae]